MTKDKILREIQKRIAEARGYTDVRQANAYDVRLQGILHADEGRTFLPRWPQDWCDAGVLLDEMHQPHVGAVKIESFPMDTVPYSCMAFDRRMQTSGYGEGHTVAEAIARCWCVFKGIDLSDIQ